MLKWLVEDPIPTVIVMVGLATVAVLVAFLVAIVVSL
jgi:hypothetical protein